MKNIYRKYRIVFIAFTLSSFLINCKDEAVVDAINPPIIETVTVFSVSNTDAEANVDLSNIKTEISEVGIVWSDKANPTVSDKKTASGGLKEDQSVVVRLTELVKERTYYVRSYYILGDKITYGNELSFIHNFTNEWVKAPSPEIGVNEYIAADNAYWDGLQSGAIRVFRVNKVNNYTVERFYYPNFGGWDPSFISSQNRFFGQMRFNMIFGIFPTRNNQSGAIQGGGHYKDNRGNKFYLNDYTLIGVDGYNWEPVYPGAEANTSSVGMGKYAYVLENLPQGKLWRFNFEGGIKWDEMSKFPYQKQAKSLVVESKGKAYFVIEPEDWNENSLVELYEYNPANNEWVKKANFAGQNRRRGSIFTVNERIFYGTGQSIKSLAGLRDIWEYLPANNSWKKATDYPGGGTINLLAVEYTNTVAYLGFGQQVIPNATKAENIKDMEDFWRFRPQ